MVSGREGTEAGGGAMGPRARAPNLITSLFFLGFSGLIPVAEDDAWGADAPSTRPQADPATHPPLAPLLLELAAGEVAAVEAAFGPARVLLGGTAAPAAAASAAPAAAAPRPPDPAIPSGRESSVRIFRSLARSLGSSILREMPHWSLKGIRTM